MGVHHQTSVRYVMGNNTAEAVLMLIAIPVVLTASVPVAIFFLLCGPFYLLAGILGLPRN